MTYVLGLQLIASSTSSLISSVLYICIGASVYCTTLSSVRLPGCLGSISSSLTSWLHSSPPPAAVQPMGATLEIQRTQHAEAVEQQLLRARARQFNVMQGGRQMRLDEMWGQARNNRNNRPPAAPVQPSPTMVQALMDMGFSRQRVEQALIRSGNNLPEATNILLNDIWIYEKKFQIYRHFSWLLQMWHFSGVPALGSLPLRPLPWVGHAAPTSLLALQPRTWWQL